MKTGQSAAKYMLFCCRSLQKRIAVGKLGSALIRYAWIHRNCRSATCCRSIIYSTSYPTRSPQHGPQSNNTCLSNHLPKGIYICFLSMQHTHGTHKHKSMLLSGSAYRASKRAFCFSLGLRSGCWVFFFKLREARIHIF